jgi:hypothetical protein
MHGALIKIKLYTFKLKTWCVFTGKVSFLYINKLREVNLLIIMTSSNSTCAVTTETASQSKAQQICRKLGNNARSGWWMVYHWQLGSGLFILVSDLSQS